MSISSLKPALLWQYFEKLTQIPRPSHQEEAVQQFVLDEAARLGLWAERDEAGNVLVRKPATVGYEQAKGVILQSHLDMVAQKNHDTVHDFSKDPIQAYIDGDWVTARGTTLGADNGIGAAAALAVLASRDLQHGEVEALFTATEETGMDGAKGLQGNWLNGSVLLNLDNEDLEDICIGCAGGVDATFNLPLAFENLSQPAYMLRVRGLIGGHSGVEIHCQRGNALKIMARLLFALGEKVRVSDIRGGDLRNAIPREAETIFLSECSLDDLQMLIAPEVEDIRRGLPKEDQDLTVQIEVVSPPSQCWQPQTQKTILQALNACPNGVDRMSVTVSGLVETSTNLAKIACEGGVLQVQCLLRSLDDSARDDLALRMVGLFELAGGSTQLSGDYPGWQPNVEASIIDVLANEGEKLLHKKPNIGVIHAGLECGLLGQHYPHWEMAAFGPTIEMPHSPDERVHIESVAVFWQWLVNVLAVVK